jgi:hypothetical protein
LLDQDAPMLRMYPPETVIAEKLEAMVVLGIANSRMKDYYDILATFRIHAVEDAVLAQAIGATFQRRQTAVPREIPTGLSDEFGNDPIARGRWPEFLRRLRIDDAPAEFIEAVRTVRAKVWPAMRIASECSYPP